MMSCEFRGQKTVGLTPPACETEIRQAMGGEAVASAPTWREPQLKL
jgi:hypothetical protein